MLAYDVQWHMGEAPMRHAWLRHGKPLTFADEAGPSAERLADPVAPAQRSKAALAKAHTRRLPDGSAVMSFGRLLRHLGTIVRNTVRPIGARAGLAPFTLTTRPNDQQARALALLATMAV